MSAERPLESLAISPPSARNVIQDRDRLDTSVGIERPKTVHDALRIFTRAYDEIRDLGLHGEHAHSIDNLFDSASFIAGHAGERASIIRDIISDLRERMGPPLHLTSVDPRIDDLLVTLHETVFKLEEAIRQAAPPVEAGITNLQRLGQIPTDIAAHMSWKAMQRFLGTEMGALSPVQIQALQIARLYAMSRAGHRLFEEGLEPSDVVAMQAALQMKREPVAPKPETKLEPDTSIVDHPVRNLLQSNDILEALCEIERACTVSEEALVKNIPSKGIYFAHVIHELCEVLRAPGAQLLTYEQSGEQYGENVPRLWGLYIYHLDGHAAAAEDQVLFAHGNALFNPKGGNTGLLVGVAHVVCIDERVNAVLAEQNLNRGRVYLEMHAHMVQEAAQKGIRVMVATCRTHPAPNPVKCGSHELLE